MVLDCGRVRSFTDFGVACGMHSRSPEVADPAWFERRQLIEGSTKAGVLREVNVNLADYTEVFKPSTVVLPLKGNAGALLHVTIQRMQADGERREVNENGDSIVKPRRKTLESQLSKCDDEEVGNATNGLNSVEVWPDRAEEFVPERFDLKGPVPNETNTDFRFIPFSGGPRKCVGDQFALLEAIVALAVFLQSMDFELVVDQKINMTTGATIHTTNGLYMRLSPRKVRHGHALAFSESS